MFALPVTALGAVAPWAVRLAVRDVGEAGTVAGRLYALSTLGSIAGTFLPVLVLVPAIGSRRTFLVVAALLALAAVPMLGPRSLGAPAVAVGLLLIPTGLVKPGAGVALRGRVAVPVRPGGEGRTASPSCTSTRAGPSTPSTGRAPCSRAATGTRSWPCPCSAGRRPGAWRCSATPPARWLARTGRPGRRPMSTASSSTRWSPRSAGATSARGGCPCSRCTPTTPARTWPTRARATTRSWSTPTASPTSRST